MPRFIEVGDPHAVSVGKAAAAAEKTGATHVVVVFEDGTPEVLPAVDLAPGDPAPIADRVGTRLPATPFEIAEGQQRSLFHRAGLAVIYSGDQPLMLEADESLVGGDPRALFSANRFTVFAADARLLGPPIEQPGDSTVVYTCPNNHPVPQRQSNPNRNCPFCDEPLEL